jgi:hypothetical protein
MDMPELLKQERDLQRKLHETRQAKRVEIMRTKRVERRNSLSASDLKAEDGKDALYSAVFSSDDGQAVLHDLAISFPALVDGIKERINRAAAVSNTAVATQSAQANVAAAAETQIAAQGEQPVTDENSAALEVDVIQEPEPIPVRTVEDAALAARDAGQNVEPE